MIAFNPESLLQDLQRLPTRFRSSGRPSFGGVDSRKNLEPQDRSGIRKGNLLAKVNIIDQYAPDFEVDNSYLERADDIMFRANQLNTQAAMLRSMRPIDFIGGVQEIPDEVLGLAKQARRDNKRGNRSVAGRKNTNFNSFVNAISGKESGGSYRAVNSDSGALGKYQIMPSNFAGPGGWDQEALGRDVSTRQFLNSPKLQEAIARHKLRQYYNQYGVRGAASAWYSGDPNKWRDKSPQGGYPSIHAYVMDILRRTQR